MHNTKSRSFNGGAKHVLLWKGPRPEDNQLVRFEEAKNVFPAEVEQFGELLAPAQQTLTVTCSPNFTLPTTSGPTTYPQRIHAGTRRVLAFSSGTSGLHHSSLKRTGKRFLRKRRF